MRLIRICVSPRLLLFRNAAAPTFPSCCVELFLLFSCYRFVVFLFATKAVSFFVDGIVLFADLFLFYLVGTHVGEHGIFLSFSDHVSQFFIKIYPLVCYNWHDEKQIRISPNEEKREHNQQLIWYCI